MVVSTLPCQPEASPPAVLGLGHASRPRTIAATPALPHATCFAAACFAAICSGCHLHCMLPPRPPRPHGGTPHRTRRRGEGAARGAAAAPGRGVGRPAGRLAGRLHLLPR